MQPGGTSPEASVVVLCLQNASVSRHERSLVLASAHGRLGIWEVVQQMRRLRGPLGIAGIQGVLFAGGVVKDKSPHVNAENLESRTAHRKAEG